MPLDGHGHLVKQGWSGKGTGLRHGAISKPITVVQKKTLAGIGKDRDEAFPFWDHVFQAAAVSIQLKLHKDSDDESNTDSDNESGDQTPGMDLKRTATGIISNRRPLSGTPALSGATTPADSSSSSGSSFPQLSLMATAKQQAARRMLYASFYRGPVVSGEDLDEAEESSTSPEAGPSTTIPSTSLEKEPTKGRKKRKADDDEDGEKQERKRRRREAKEEQNLKSKSKGKEQAVDGPDEDASHHESADRAARAERKAEKAERKRQRAEKLARKEERRQKRAERKASSQEKAEGDDRNDTSIGTVVTISVGTDGTADTPETARSPPKREKKAKREKKGLSDVDASSEGKKGKKKAKKL
ncbi:hypothetical protein C8Q78DRAFT_974032 [Trametes maxima]|nr:hypothetical protein C8Q78DRAFT_974032 [Trametes maxima]